MEAVWEAGLLLCFVNLEVCYYVRTDPSVYLSKLFLLS